jgi:hypothetical protein
MKSHLTRWILGLSMLFAVGAASKPADAQVVVRVGPAHRHYYHHHYYRHAYYRNGHRYYR